MKKPVQSDAPANRRQFRPTREVALPKGIASVTMEGPYGLVVTFTDATYAMYPVEELLELRPHRESLQKE